MTAEEKYKLMDDDFENPEPVSMLRNLENSLRNTRKTSQSISSWAPRRLSKNKNLSKYQSVYATLKTQPTFQTVSPLWAKPRVNRTNTVREFRTTHKSTLSRNTPSLYPNSKKPRITRELSDLCSLDIQSKQFKLKLLINNISTLRLKEPKMAEVLNTHLDRSNIKKRIGLFKKSVLPQI